MNLPESQRMTSTWQYSKARLDQLEQRQQLMNRLVAYTDTCPADLVRLFHKLAQLQLEQSRKTYSSSALQAIREIPNYIQAYGTVNDELTRILEHPDVCPAIRGWVKIDRPNEVDAPLAN